ncbi:MAG TPA: hypothetical protein ENH94_10640 [Phycisphaerales bacterium]|nr:hypothetical protein [Phycisphaerales bacterium]
MNLKEFIKETITEISGAISECNAELTDDGTIVNPKNVSGASIEFGKIYGYLEKGKDYKRPVHLVHFDVAVTATDKTGKKGGIGIAVGSIGLGAQGKSEAENVSFSKLTFSIPVALPVGNE